MLGINMVNINIRKNIIPRNSIIAQNAKNVFLGASYQKENLFHEI